MLSYHTDSPDETEALGAEVAARLRPGDVVLVEGDMGAGKTTFVRGACRALGVSAVVSSPTFTIGQRYTAPVPVSHLDLFRIASLRDEDPELLADYVGPDRIAFVEWPPGEEEVSGFGRIAYHVRIGHEGDDRRHVTVEAAAEAAA